MSEATVTRKCKECKQAFSISNEEARWFLDKQLELPKRCPDCRKNNREKREANIKVKAAENKEEVVENVEETPEQED